MPRLLFVLVLSLALELVAQLVSMPIPATANNFVYFGVQQTVTLHAGFKMTKENETLLQNAFKNSVLIVLRRDVLNNVDFQDDEIRPVNITVQSNARIIVGITPSISPARAPTASPSTSPSPIVVILNYEVVSFDEGMTFSLLSKDLVEASNPTQSNQLTQTLAQELKGVAVSAVSAPIFKNYAGGFVSSSETLKPSGLTSSHNFAVALCFISLLVIMGTQYYILVNEQQNKDHIGQWRKGSNQTSDEQNQDHNHNLQSQTSHKLSRSDSTAAFPKRSFLERGSTKQSEHFQEATKIDGLGETFKAQSNPMLFRNSLGSRQGSFDATTVNQVATPAIPSTTTTTTSSPIRGSSSALPATRLATSSRISAGSLMTLPSPSMSSKSLVHSGKSTPTTWLAPGQLPTQSRPPPIPTTTISTAAGSIWGSGSLNHPTGDSFRGSGRSLNAPTGGSFSGSGSSKVGSGRVLKSHLSTS